MGFLSGAEKEEMMGSPRRPPDRHEIQSLPRTRLTVEGQSRRRDALTNCPFKQHM